MPLLLQARITSVSFEEARYRHYRARQRRDGALQKAAEQVKKRAPSPLESAVSPPATRCAARYAVRCAIRCAATVMGVVR